MSGIGVLTLTMVVTMAFLVLGGLLFIAKTYHKVGPDEALLVSTTEDLHVVLEKGAVVMPTLHRAASIDLSLRTFDVSRSLVCADDIRADVEATIYLRIPRDENAIKSVARDIGAEAASDPDALRDLFMPKVEHALAAAFGESNFEDLYRERAGLRDRVLQQLEGGLEGFRLEDVSLERIEQTPLEELDPNNAADARAIHRIRAQTLERRVKSMRLDVQAHPNEAGKRLELADALWDGPVEVEFILGEEPDEVARDRRDEARAHYRRYQELEVGDATPDRVEERLANTA